MMRRTRAMLVAGLLTTIPAFGQTIQQKSSTLSDVEFQAMNDGRFGLNVSALTSGFIVPRGSNLSYMFGSGIWFGTRKMSGGEMRKLTFITYNPTSGVSWAVPGEGYLEPDPGGDRPASPSLFHSTDFDSRTGAYTGKSGWPNTTASWPLWLLPAEHANAMMPGWFAPYNAGRTVAGPAAFSAPAFVAGADEQFVARFHDNELERYEGDMVEGYPIGLQIEQNIYAWREGPLKDAVVLAYMFVNTSRDTLHDCTIGYLWDPDLGEPGNDAGMFYTRRPGLRTAFNWTGAEEQGGYGALATTLIAAPMVGASGFIDNGWREGFRSQGRAGAFRSWMMEEDPVTPAARYDFMSAGGFDADAVSGDKRGMLATTKFSMRPGDTAYFAIGHAVIPGSPGQDGAFGELEHVAESEMGFYYNPDGLVPSGVPLPVAGSGEALALLPNPAHDRASIGFTLRASGRVVIRLVNALGEVVATWKDEGLGVGGHRRELDLGGMAPGAYIVTVATGEGESAARLMVVR